MSLPRHRRHNQIGLDRLVRLKWLERTAYLFLAGNDAPAVKAALQEDLEGAFRSKNTKIRGSMDKTITILMKIWVRPPRDLHPLQREGLKLLSRLPREDHIAIHWSMAMAVYPFWGAVAAHVGRLLRLQGTAAASQVQRRVREQYGEKDAISRRVRYVLRSFVDWEVLKETSEKGIYTAGLSLTIDQVELIAWLAEAFLHAHPNGSVDLRTVLDSTSLFPFHLSKISAAHLVALSGRLDVLRHGLDQDLIMLRTENLPAAKGGGS
jgi:Holliday junction resolvase-like predicted endonuclease